MTDISATVSMLETMPEEARKKVLSYTKQLFYSYRPENPYTPVSTEKILKDIDASTEEFSMGLGKDAREAIEEMRRRHGFV